MKKSISCDIVHLSGCDCSCVGICILSERRRKKEITVGFVYVGDASTAYTSNFIDAQETIQTKYGDQVKVIALNNVAGGNGIRVLTAACGCRV